MSEINDIFAVLEYFLPGEVGVNQRITKLRKYIRDLERENIKLKKAECTCGPYDIETQCIVCEYGLIKRNGIQKDNIAAQNTAALLKEAVELLKEAEWVYFSLSSPAFCSFCDIREIKGEDLEHREDCPHQAFMNKLKGKF